MSALMERPSQELVQREKIIDFLNAFGFSDLSEKEKTQFVEIAQAYGLNPFKREIHCVAYGSGDYRTMSIVVGYEVYLKRAERSGQLDGWNVELKGSLQPHVYTKKRWNKTKKAHEEVKFTGWAGDLSAVITIHRKDRSKPITHEVWFDEYNGQNEIWNSKPRSQLRKVAISQGFRLAFPDELAGLPYTFEETDSIPEMVNVTEEKKGMDEKRESELAPIPPVEMSEPKEIVEIRAMVAELVRDGLVTMADGDLVMKVAVSKSGTELQIYFDKLAKRAKDLKAQREAEIKAQQEAQVATVESSEVTEDPAQLDIF